MTQTNHTGLFMGKGDKKTLTPLAAIPKKEQQPRKGGRFVKPSDDAGAYAYHTRCKIFGIQPTPDNLLRMAQPMAGFQLGMVLIDQIKSHDERLALWNTWQSFCGSVRTYRSRILGIQAGPKGASDMSMPNPQEPSTDTRTDDEKDEAAKSNYFDWQSLRFQVEGNHGLLAAAETDSLTVWAEKQTTTHGKWLLTKLVELHGLAKS